MNSESKLCNYHLQNKQSFWNIFKNFEENLDPINSIIKDHKTLSILKKIFEDYKIQKNELLQQIERLEKETECNFKQEENKHKDFSKEIKDKLKRDIKGNGSLNKNYWDLKIIVEQNNKNFQKLCSIPLEENEEETKISQVINEF